MKRSLPYKTFYLGSSYSAAHSSYHFCDRSKLFAVLNLPVNCLLGSWYCDVKYALQVYKMKVLKKKIMISQGVVYEYIICNIK